MVENLSKFLRTKNKLGQIDGFEQKRCTMHTHFGIKKQTEKQTEKRHSNRSVAPTRDRTRSRTYSYERQKRAPSAHARTIVRREHQAHCAHPAVGITSTEPGGLARLRKTICKLKRFVNDLERSTDILCRWSALIVVTIIASRTARISASSAR